MGRMHSRGKGMSSSALPYKKSPPSWLKTSTTEVSFEFCCIVRSAYGAAAHEQHTHKLLPLIRSKS